MSDQKTPPVTVKSEPGTYKRLPSFRSPRDLKLTEFRQAPASADSKPKKVYMPNLNVQRRKPTEETPSTSSSSESQKVERGKRNEERGRGRGRRIQNIIQAGSGVFAQGLAPSTKITARWSGGGGGSSAESAGPVFLQKPKLNLDKLKVDKEEEELVMKQLTEDFLDDPELEPDFNNCPIKLPLQDFKSKVFIKEELVDEVKCKTEVEDTDGIEVKTEPGIEKEEKQTSEEKPRDMSQMKPLSIEEMLVKSAESSFIFLQLPHCMPKLEFDVQKDVNQTSAASTSKSQAPAPTDGESQEEDKTVLRTLPSGQIGTLQILKSGRAKLVLGDVKLWIESGAQACFKQDLMSVSLNHNAYSGSMVNLGPITTRMIVSPDWESLLVKGVVK